MLSFTGSRNLAGTLTNNASASNLTVMDSLINICDAKIINFRNWDFLEGDKTLSTIANQQYYKLPYNCTTLKSVTVTISSIAYQPKECPTRDFWNYLNESTITTADQPEWYYISEGKIGFYPIPTASYINNIALVFEQKRKDLSIADYTTGTITTCPYTVAFTAIVAIGATSATLSGAWALTTGSYIIEFSSGEQRVVTLTNGGTAVTFTALTLAAIATVTVYSSTLGSLVVGNGTTWTSKMEGRWMRITDSNTANTGDGFWYKIEEVFSTTQLSIVPTYGGDALASASAVYTIGQTSLIPEDYQDLPVFKAAEIYYTSIQPEKDRAVLYKTLFNEGMKILVDDFSEKGTSPVVEDEYDEFDMINNNLFVRY